ncbi:MAG TPA: phenylalanine--tRNA ligase subunit beta [Acidobacteriota bacterium]|nr:phenylalanine--tRNA ligase subunit beta [Acidobacteriota bacterium]
MKIGTRWLQDYITFPYGAEELADRLTAIGTAVDGIEPVFERFTGVIAGRIKSVEAHPSRPDLYILVVNCGAEDATVVAGAPNCRVGLLIPLARPGATLPGGDGAPITARTFAGVTSAGMCCSERDLGLTEDHTGLMELDAETITVGADLWDALELDEVALSFELTPNRGDCLSVLGIAREIGALVGSRVRRPEIHLTQVGEDADHHLTVTIEDTDGCPRYAGRLVRGGRIRPSPFWLKRRIRGAGLRAINNAVDITNFVMLETGQPLHAFDWGTFASGQVVVKTAKAGEEFTTLDGVARILPADAVMITDGTRNVAIGGIMGGEDSEVEAGTADFMIESAHFKPLRIRRARNKLGLATDSALRFEKGVDPNGVPYALDRAAELFVKLTGGELLAGAVDEYPAPIEPIKLELDPERANRLLGTSMSNPSMIDYLSRLEFGVVPGKRVMVTVPTFRPDVTRPVDLVEEIARIHGYDKIPVARRASGALPTPRARQGAFEMRLREIMEGLGFTEIVCNSLIDPDLVLAPDVRPVRLRNPLSSDLAVMRADLIGSALLVIAHNRNRRVDSVAVYEIGKTFAPQDGDWPFAEQRHLLLALCGEAPAAGWDGTARTFDFFTLKGAVATLFEDLDLTLRIEPLEESPFKRGEGFAISSGAERVGSIGAIDPGTARRFGVKDPVWVAVIAVDDITPADETTRQYTPLPKFPAVYRDLAVVVDAAIPAGDLDAVIREAGGPFIESVRLFDRYSGTPIPKEKVSLAFAITFRDAERTLTDPEVDQAHKEILAELARRFGAELRS